MHREYLQSLAVNLMAQWIDRKFNTMYAVVIIIVFWAVSLPPAWLTLKTIGVEEVDTEVVDKEKYSTQ